MNLALPELTIALVIIGALLLIVYPAARICRRLGYPMGLGLLAVVPLANVALLWFVAQSRWPIDGSRRDPLASPPAETGVR